VGANRIRGVRRGFSVVESENGLLIFGYYCEENAGAKFTGRLRSFSGKLL